MITGFACKLAEDIYYDKKTRETRKFPNELYRIARRKLLYLYEADELKDLRVPPNNRLEALKGDLKGYHSIRINRQWRLVFKWSKKGADEVQVLDYH
ncbi:MAG: type II toxin-antitoxin system RelE/ParE family toxin [Bacteriovoracaceae bacterium]|nr:type II toxin-antitoxin system RelE/ParE family toxin [Bacteriovoracaceae bacterium]